MLHYGDLEDNAQGEVTFESLQEKSKSQLPLSEHNECSVRCGSHEYHPREKRDGCG